MFLINEAVYGRARGGVQPARDLEQAFFDELEGKNARETAWTIGQQYLSYTGGCKKQAIPEICKALTEIEQNQEGLSQEVQDYIAVVNFATRPGLKAEAIKTAMPYLDQTKTPAFIVRTAAMARAKMKPAQASTVGVTNINAETLLKTALAKDPYDPNTYVGLAQVLAAKGAFEQSWDIYDALRAGISTADTVDLKINRLEEKLRKLTPGYFLGE